MESEMLDSSHKIGAKKSFFLYPSRITEDILIKNLVRHEYEAFSINDAYRLMPVLKDYSNSIVFINLDSGPRNFNWEKYVNDITANAEDLSIAAVYFENSHLCIENRYSNVIIEGNRIKLEDGHRDLLPGLLDLLENKNARGKRRYIRAKCNDQYSASFSIKYNREIYNGWLLDISSYGMACCFNTEVDLISKTYIDDIQLRLKGMVSHLSGIVYGIREIRAEKIYVIVFDYRKYPQTRLKIHDFIYAVMHREIRRKLG